MMDSFHRFVIGVVVMSVLAGVPGDLYAGQALEQTGVSKNLGSLVWAECVLALVLVTLLALAWKRGGSHSVEIRGLGLPRGSVRSALALMIVGSTINFLLFGSAVAGEHFSEVVAALGTLSASVVGFYFGGRTAAPAPETRTETQLSDAQQEPHA